jgi:CDP-paratose 2-epimerase
MAATLVTGGAGFVGSNVVESLLGDRHRVIVLDSLRRPGSERNISWLKGRHPKADIRFVDGDVRDFETVQAAVREADVVYHLAGQVAVTSSVDDPRTDFEINAGGTLNVLEAARLSKRPPTVVFTSTNKVYGALEDVAVLEEESRYVFRDHPHGIAESQPLDFHSPYGCSKGTADQYVRDYARIYGVSTVVFRMSCIYGPRQFGNEDQGWLAHFAIAAAYGRPLTIYGNGKQVRDVLYVDDLVRALRLAVEEIDRTAGEVYNIGGGPANTVSIWAEFGEVLASLADRRIPVDFERWRPGDQPCYVSDIRKAKRELGWEPEVAKDVGIERLWRWIRSNEDAFATPRTAQRASAGAPSAPGGARHSETHNEIAAAVDGG